MLLKSCYEKEKNYATGFHTSKLASKRALLLLRLKFSGQILINLVNVPSGLNNIEAEPDDLNLNTLNNVPAKS